MLACFELCVKKIVLVLLVFSLLIDFESKSSGENMSLGLECNPPLDPPQRGGNNIIIVILNLIQDLLLFVYTQDIPDSLHSLDSLWSHTVTMCHPSRWEEYKNTNPLRPPYQEDRIQNPNQQEISFVLFSLVEGKPQAFQRVPIG